MHIDPSIGPDRARAVFDEELQGSASDAALRGLRHRWLARSGSWIAAFMEQLAAAAPADRKAIGRGANELKRHVEQAIEAREAALAATRRPEGAVDITLPGRQPALGFRHPLSLIREQIGDIFSRLGYQVLEGSEIEDDYHNFEALNMPAEHPARDMQDTLYMPKAFRSADAPRKADEAILLRTHTSSVQVRTMLSRKPPFRIVAPGRCFRRDAVDATHSANFHQVEGLWIDRDVTLADLRGVLDFFVKETFGADAEIRLRPSFFPFTEPSFEMDLRSPNLGRLSDRWLEIMGCGLVDPKVLELCGLDPKEWSGLAFGLGLERIAMLVHGIDDIRHFYNNDTRFLRQFA